MQNQSQPKRAIRETEVRVKIGLSHTTIWRLVREDKFPKPFRIGKRAVAWNEADVDAWLNARQLRVA